MKSLIPGTLRHVLKSALKPVLRASVFATLLFAQTAQAGTWEMVEKYPEGGCVEVPANTMCLSACAFGWLKASTRVNRGIVGFHLPYDPKTKQSTIAHQLVTRSFLNQYDSLGLWNAIVDTTPSRFVMMQNGRVWSADWKTARAGMKVTSDPKSLRRC